MEHYVPPLIPLDFVKCNNLCGIFELLDPAV